MAEELAGKVAAVTGGASGIRLASAEAMMAAGARVVVIDQNQAALARLEEQHGDKLIALPLDLLDPSSCASLLPEILQHAGQLDIFHANAGLYVGGDLIDADHEAIDRMLDDWPEEKLREARESDSLLEPEQVAEVILFMLTRPRGMTIRDVVMMPSNFDL